MARFNTQQEGGGIEWDEALARALREYSTATGYRVLILWADLLA